MLIYLAAAYILVGRGLLGDLTGRIVSINAGYDPSQPIWYMAWFPFAITHHLDPFLTRYVWAPDGMNVAWATSMPAASLLAWPMTSALGPVAAFNTWCFVSLPLAAFGAFLLCQHLTGRNGASILGGYVFGFSPYFLSHLQSHLILILAFPVPLAILLMVRLLEGTVRPRIFIPLMAVLLALQFGLSLELFASLTAVGSRRADDRIRDWPGALARRGAKRDASRSRRVMGSPLLLSAPLWYYLFAFGFPQGRGQFAERGIDRLSELPDSHRHEPARRQCDARGRHLAIRLPSRGRWMDSMATPGGLRALPPRAMAQTARQGAHGDAGAARDRIAGTAPSHRWSRAVRVAMENRRAHPAGEECAARPAADVWLPDPRRDDGGRVVVGGTAEAREVCARDRDSHLHAAESRLSLLDPAAPSRRPFSPRGRFTHFSKKTRPW